MAPILRRIRPLRALRTQKADHYISPIGIKMRSGQYAATRQDSDAGGGVGRRSALRSATRGLVCLTLMRVQAVLKARGTLSGPHVPERLFFGYEGV
jgi:hypothetical protein